MACNECGAKRGHLHGCSKSRGAYTKIGKGKMSPRERAQTRWLWVRCPTCLGKGVRGIRPCGLCKGKGEIKIPDEDD